MGMVKRFAEEVSVVLGDEGELTGFSMRVAEKAMSEAQKHGIGGVKVDSDNEEFIEFIRTIESKVREGGFDCCKCGEFKDTSEAGFRLSPGEVMCATCFTEGL